MNRLVARDLGGDRLLAPIAANRGVRRRSRHDHLSVLVANGVDEVTALQSLAAWHTQSDAALTPFRSHQVCAGERVFPSADTVPPLLAIALSVLRDLFARCQSDSDEVLVTTYGVYLITAIHPFGDRNGHVAFDFGQYLLMRRWGCSAPPLRYRSDTHRVLGIAFVDLDVPNTGTSLDDLLALFEEMLQRLDGATLPRLWTTPNLVAAAHFLAQGSGIDFVPRCAVAATALHASLPVS